MAYLAVVQLDRVVTKAELLEFAATVPEYKRCPTRLYGYDKDCDYLEDFGSPTSDQIWVGGSYTHSGHLYRPYVERLMRWFRKVKNVRCSADYS